MTNDERQWGMLAHILTLVVAYLTGFGWLCALVIYLTYKDKSRFVAFHALQSLYFQIAVFVAWIITIVLCFVLVGLLLIPVVAIASIVWPIIAGLAANKGELYEYPVFGKMARQSVGI